MSGICLDISKSASLSDLGDVDRISIASSNTLSSSLAKWASPVATALILSLSANSKRAELISIGLCDCTST